MEEGHFPLPSSSSMNSKSIICLGIASAALVLNARASFHLFDIQEVYSNGDGSVQFIELFTTFSGQQFLSGHTVRSEVGVVPQNTFNLSSLPGDTTNKTFLMGTSNLVALYGITPDFIIPANFFSAGSDHFLSFAEGTDRVNLTNLPTSGTMSLNGITGNEGQTAAATSINAQATPTNFAGQTVTIPEPGIAGLLLSALGATALVRRRPR